MRFEDQKLIVLYIVEITPFKSGILHGHWSEWRLLIFCISDRNDVVIHILVAVSVQDIVLQLDESPGNNREGLSLAQTCIDLGGCKDAVGQSGVGSCHVVMFVFGIAEAVILVVCPIGEEEDIVFDMVFVLHIGIRHVKECFLAPWANGIVGKPKDRGLFLGHLAEGNNTVEIGQIIECIVDKLHLADGLTQIDQGHRIGLPAAVMDLAILHAEETECTLTVFLVLYLRAVEGSA